MEMNTSFGGMKQIIMLLFVFSFVSTFFAYDFSRAYGYGETSVVIDANLSDSDISSLAGAFAPLVSIGGSPFIALTILSGAGSMLNSGSINAENVPFANTLMQLPISNTGVFVTLLLITITKFLLSLLSATKIFCDAILGKIENLAGTLCVAGGAFLVTSVSTVYAAEIVMANVGSAGIGSFILTNAIAFLSAVFAYGIYEAIKTMVASIDIFAFLFSSFPGATGVFTVVKHLTIGFYTWLAMVNPIVSAVIGIILVIIACLVFRAAKRQEIYYKRVYLIPFVNFLFRRGQKLPLVPKKLPRGVASEFNSVDICLESFFMNKTSKLYKREQCYFIRSGETNYIFKKRFFGKVIKFELSGDTYIEKPLVMRIIKIFHISYASIRK